MRIEAYDDPRAFPPRLPAAWNGLLAPDRVTEGADVTATFEWNAALMESFFGGGGGAVVLVAYDAEDRVAAVLPVCRPAASDALLPRGHISLLSDLYCGRIGLPMRDASPELVDALLGRIDRYFPNWNCLHFTSADGNRNPELMSRTQGGRWLAITAKPVEASPYIDLPGSFDDYFKTLKPSFRTEVRRGERRLREQGTLERRLFHEPADVEALWEAVCTIEKQSWKEGAGTSITRNAQQERFYRALLPRAASAGQLFSTVLFLDGRPIAHQLCLRREATAAILKMSYVEELQKHYPATVLLTMYLRDIIELGLRYLDFMGTREDFKMRWTDLSYGRTTYSLYRRTMAGRSAYLRLRAANFLARLRDKSATPLLEAGNRARAE